MPQAQYTPGQNHPWRQYKNKARTADSQDVVEEPKMPLKQFLSDVVENWDTYQIPPENYDSRDYQNLAKLSPSRQAEWLIGFVKKHWMAGYKGAIILE